MTKYLKNKVVYIIATIGIIFILMIIIKFTYTLKLPCQIVGQKEWVLIQVEPDKIISKIYDNRKDQTLNFTLLQFAREDFVQFRQFSTADYWVNKEDPIASFTSLDNQISMANLTGELEKARDNLAIATAGEKQALLEEAKRALELANIQFNAFEPQYLRNKELYEKNLISSAEWEITRATYDGFQSNIALKKARLEVMQTGEKDEIIRYTKDHIEQLKSQVLLMNTKLDMGNITAPFDGMISYPSQDSVICLVEKVDSLLCKLPAPASELKYLEPGLEINIRLFEIPGEHLGELLDIGHRMKLINGSPSYILTGYLDSTSNKAGPGMTGIAEIQCDNITLLEHLVRSFNKYVMQI
jgi:hypothetical protein